MKAAAMWKPLLALVFLATPVASQQVTSAPGGVLRALDKTSGQTVDIEMRAGETHAMGSLQIRLRECRYPAGNPSGNAYAAIDVVERGKDAMIFSGWMIATAPALSAMEHRRYDVWVIRCTT